MSIPFTITQKRLFDFLLAVALALPVFIWGPPGIGKSSIVSEFSESVGLPCVSLAASRPRKTSSASSRS